MNGNDRQRARRVVAAALLFELGLGVLAVALSLLFGLAPWRDLAWSPELLARAVLATAPMVAMIPLLERGRWAWARRLRRFIEQRLAPLFSGVAWWSLGLISLAAGIGEELLFRGFVLTGLNGMAGPAMALVASALVFGLAHAITPAYFVLTTLAGLYLGGLYLATGNLLLPIVVHFLYDWIALIWLLRQRKPQPCDG